MIDTSCERIVSITHKSRTKKNETRIVSNHHLILEAYWGFYLLHRSYSECVDAVIEQFGDFFLKISVDHSYRFREKRIKREDFLIVGMEKMFFSFCHRYCRGACMLKNTHLIPNTNGSLFKSYLWLFPNNFYSIKWWKLSAESFRRFGGKKDFNFSSHSQYWYKCSWYGLAWI